MKLYATVTSERGKEVGKGGNDHIEIAIMVYDRYNPLYTIKITRDELLFMERGYNHPLLTRSHRDIRKQKEGKT